MWVQEETISGYDIVVSVDTISGYDPIVSSKIHLNAAYGDLRLAGFTSRRKESGQVSALVPAQQMKVNNLYLVRK